MEIAIFGKGVELTDGLRAYIQKRLGGLERYSRNIISSELILDETRGRFSGELILKVKGTTLVAKAQAKDPYQAIDMLKDKMKDALKAYEQKLRSKRG